MIEIKDIYKVFGHSQVLNGMTLSVNKGETKAIIGRSGVGKSVLLKCIMGLMQPDSGSIKVDGVELTRLNDREYDKFRMKMGYVFQGGALFDSMSVGENVAFVLEEFMNFSPKEIKERVTHALSLVGLKEVDHLSTDKLSGGMRKRVSLARVLCMRPEIIFYDEPTSEVDPITADIINQLIVDLRNKLGVTSIVVTHDMNAAYKIGNSVAMIYHGQVIADGTPEEIRTSTHPVVRQFINGEAQGPIAEDEDLVLGYDK